MAAHRLLWVWAVNLDDTERHTRLQSHQKAGGSCQGREARRALPAGVTNLWVIFVRSAPPVLLLNGSHQAWQERIQGRSKNRFMTWCSGWWWVTPFKELKCRGHVHHSTSNDFSSSGKYSNQISCAKIIKMMSVCLSKGTNTTEKHDVRGLAWTQTSWTCFSNECKYTDKSRLPDLWQKTWFIYFFSQNDFGYALKRNTAS